MREQLRFSAFGGVWRVAFAFDPLRQAILLVAGDKSGVSQKLFYKHLIQKADAKVNKKGAALYKAMGKHQLVSIRRISRNRAELVAYYRLFSTRGCANETLRERLRLLCL